MGIENSLKSMKVLYVEDEPITRDQVSRHIKNEVGRVISVASGEQGIKSFSEYQPDIIVTDLIMKDMSGIEMMETLRKRGIETPFIITSSLSDSESILEAVDLRIEKYLVKPIDLDLLSETLKNIATEIVGRREDVVDYTEKFVLSDKNKRELELEIRNLYAGHLKELTGKGANLINVFINGREVEIILKNQLTTLEESLIALGDYHKMIEVIRKTIYESALKDFAKSLHKLMDRKVEVKKVEVYSKERFERVILEIK